MIVAFASGGRRRSEIAGLRHEQLAVEPPISPRMTLLSPQSPQVAPLY